MKEIIKYLKTSWERVLFGIVGAVCLYSAYGFLQAKNIPYTSALFGMAFFSFFYSNLSRFKKFKGLGFEAELWEDKQKEAANLIDRLKSVVSIYTHEILMGNVMRGRFGGGGDGGWKAIWKLYDDLTGQHLALGQKIDFSKTKHEMDSVFLFDLCSPLASSVSHTIESKKAEIAQGLQIRFGPMVTDVDGFSAEHQKLRSIDGNIDQLFERSKNENIARSVLKLAEDARAKMQDRFGTAPEFDEKVIQRLEALAAIADTRPLVISDHLMEFAGDEAWVRE